MTTGAIRSPGYFRSHMVHPSWLTAIEQQGGPDTGQDAIHRLRLLGTQITETGTQQCASPVSRVLAYSRAKARALIPILQREQSVLGDAVRAVVICDFERPPP